MPLFNISVPSILAGICVGLLTVILSARSPAKKASKASPLAAVSGNANDMQPVRKAANTTLFTVDTSLGIHHAKSSKKNFVLMVGSFSLSIILFLSFSVTIDFMKHTLTPLQPWTPDLSIISEDQTCSVKSGFIEELNSNPAVEKVYGRMFAYNVPIASPVHSRSQKSICSLSPSRRSSFPSCFARSSNSFIPRHITSCTV